MAFADKKGINLASPFKLQAEELLDVRQQVNSIAERNELVTLHAATAGLRVYVKADKCSYVYNGSGWDKIATSVYSHPTGDGNLHVPATGTTHNNQVLTAGSTAGSIAWKTITASMISDLPKYSLSSFGITASATELNYMKGVTSAVQTQLNDKAAKDHTHTSVNDSANSSSITFSYSNASLKYKDYSYIAAWNGYELRAVSKEQFAAANHTHPYIPMAGAIIPGQIYKGDSGNWISDRDNVAVEGISIDTGHYNCVVGQATQQGHWSMGNFAGSENLYFNYTTNTDYKVKNNTSLVVQLPNQTGTIITSATIGSQSVNHANSADSATAASKLGTNAGSATQPVYFTGGVPKACTYTLGKSVPSDAVFTDHTYTLSSFGITASATELNYMKGVTSAVQTQLNGKAASGHTHPLATTGAAGFMPKLGGGTSTFLRADGTWATPPNTDTTYSKFTGASSSAAGTIGLVPAPAAGASNRYLRSDGTWSVPPDTNTWTAMKGASSAAAGTAGYVPAPAAGASNRYLRSDGTWSVPPDTNTTYTLGSFGITASATELNYVKGVTSSIQTQLNGKAASGHTHNYAGSSSAGGAATSAVSVVDYNSTASIISIGFTGAGLSSSTFKYFAGYDGNGHIKDGSIDVVKSVLGLSSYLPTSGGTITGPLKFTAMNAFEGNPSYILGIESFADGGELKYKPVSNLKVGYASTADTATTATSATSATSATKLTSNAGSATQPVYFTGGVPKACTYTLGKSVPSNAVFTDTWTAFKGATASAAGTAGYAPAPTAGASNRYLRSDGTWSVPPDTNTTYTLSSFGITASATELNYVKGVTSSIQTQLNGKASSSHSHSAATTSAAGFMPKLSGSSSQVLRGDGTWGYVSGTDTKVTNTLGTTTKAYITGTTSSATNTGTQVFDTGVYLTDTPGQIHADSAVEIGGASLQWDSANKRITIVFS